MIYIHKYQQSTTTTTSIFHWMGINTQRILYNFSFPPSLSFSLSFSLSLFISISLIFPLCRPPTLYPPCCRCNMWNATCTRTLSDYEIVSSKCFFFLLPFVVIAIVHCCCSCLMFSIPWQHDVGRAERLWKWHAKQPHTHTRLYIQT